MAVEEICYRYTEYICKPRVLSPSGSAFCAILRASVVAMSTLQGTTTRMMVSLLAIYFSIRFLI